MAIQLVVPGAVVNAVPEPHAEIPGATVLVEATVAETVRGAQQEQVVTLPPGVAKEDVVVELELGDGVRQWSALTQLQEDGVAVVTPTRGGESAIRILPVVRHADGTRGVGSWITTGLKVLGVDPARVIARELVAGKFEDRLKVGLYGLARDGAFIEPPAQWSPEPYLLFIHGTASSTHGAFAQLFDPKQIEDYQALFDRYDQRVIALEHKTLGLSPIANALELAEKLPPHARLHMVSHSRGGLVGELLSLDPAFDPESLQPFLATGKNEHRTQSDALRRLRDLLGQKQFAIEKFVRVACPARGTILASKRLDLYASVILNVLLKLPALYTGPVGDAVFDGLKEVLLGLIKLRTDPAELPGLEAQMPTSPLVNFLRRQRESNRDLAVISGDVQGSGFFGHLKTLATDAFYRTDHDLVVDTQAMYGGIPRKQPYYFFDKGADVNHFSYFKNKKTRSLLGQWLTSSSGFYPYSMTIDAKLPPSPRDSVERPVLFVVPAEFGSVLADEDVTVWPSVGELLRRGVGKALHPENKLTPRALVAAYQPLLDYFGNSRYEVRPMPWDWRNSIDDAAANLAAATEEALGQNRPLRFIGHGLGGLVIRAMAARHPGLWQRAGARALFLGAPIRGTHWGLTLLTGANRLARRLAMVESTDPAKIGELFVKCPGILDLLPSEYLPIEDDGTEARWKSLGLEYDGGRLAASAERRQAVTQVLEATFSVVGETDQTPAAVRRAMAGIQIGNTAYGDGRVTWESAAPPLPEIEPRFDPPWHFAVPFGQLITAGGAFAGYASLLDSGDTNLLPRPRQIAAPRDVLWTGGDDVPLLFPEDDELADSAFGPRGTRSTVASPQPPLRITIKNGGVNTANHPVLVGHYSGDAIVSVEKVLDVLLDKALSRRFHLGVYPGAEGTCAVVFGAPYKKPGGAVVIGLGEVGKLNSEKLRRAVTDAAIRYSLAVVERLGDAAPPAVSLSSVLVGSNGGASLSAESSIHAVVRGILDTNRAFVMRDHDMRIDEIEFVELVENRAVIAAHVLRTLKARIEPELVPGETIETVHELETTDYIRYDSPLSDYAGGWPRRVRIAAEQGPKDHERMLRFTVLTDRARAETTLQGLSDKIVRDLVDTAATDGLFDLKTAGALYELLTPNDIKDAASDESEVVLILDDEAAQYPWELCIDRLRPGTAGGAEQKPLSLEMGLIRQFETVNFRLHPRTPRSNFAFVLGDTESGLAKLEGAEKEARRVAEVLKSRDYTVTELYQARSFDVVRELFASDYRILHIAAHGEFDETHPKSSGIVLGPGLRLSARDLRQLRVVPELVFLNCCHLGKLGTNPSTKFHRIAASVARELIEMGVAAVVAAGWAVNDAAAETFAATFYDEIITQGASFSAAVKASRNRTWTLHRETNTWGAYQCYGNPDFRLVVDGGGGSTQTPFCSRHEYLSRFRGARAESNLAGFDEQRRADVVAELKRLRGAMNSGWADGEIESAYALAIAELGDYRTAIDTLEKARTAEKATMPVNALEQLANFRARYAAEMYQQTGNLTPDIREHFDKSLELLQWLLQSGKTGERLALLGATWKRLAFVTAGTDQRDALRNSADFYEQAKNLTRKLYPLLNWALVESFSNPGRQAEIVTAIEARAGELEQIAKRATDFWDALAAIDGVFTSHIVSRAGADAIRQVARDYRTVAVRFGTAVKLRSVREHFAFTAKMLRTENRIDEAAAVDDILAALT